MRKSFRLKDLDCANCAAKMERNIKKLPGVRDAVVSFMTSKLTVEAEDSEFEAVLGEMERVIRKVEPDCAIVR